MGMEVSDGLSDKARIMKGLREVGMLEDIGVFLFSTVLKDGF